MIIKSVTQLALCASASLFSVLVSASSTKPPIQPADLAGEQVSVTQKSPNTAKFHEALKSIMSSTEISGTAFRLLSVQRTTYLVDLRGRYVLRNPVIEDMWSGEAIRTGAELEASKRKVKLENLGFKFNEMFSYSYGKGPVVAVFVDPLDFPETLFHGNVKFSKSFTGAQRADTVEKAKALLGTAENPGIVGRHRENMQKRAYESLEQGSKPPGP